MPTMTWGRHIALLLLVGCGGKLQPDGDAAVQGDGAASHGPPCTQATCGPSVQTLSSVSTAEGEQLVPTGLFVGGGFIYVSTPTHLVRAPALGGPIEIVAESNLTSAILADDHDVYWSTTVDPHVYRMPHTGGSPVAIAAVAISAQIFLDATYLYWTDGGAVWRVPTAGGTPAIVSAAPADPPGLLVDGALYDMGCSSVAVASSGAVLAGYDMVVDSSRCYMLHGTDCGPSWGCGDLVSTPIGGGEFKVLASRGSSGSATAFDVQRMMIDDTGVYLRRGDAFGNTLIRVAFDGRSIVDVTSDSALAFEVSDVRIYWATLANGSVVLKSMPKYAP